jgi:hypothetical protein
MTRSLAMCCLAIFAGLAVPLAAQEKPALRLVQTIPLPVGQGNSKFARETMDGIYYDAELERIYMTGGRWYGTPEASPGWIYVYQQKDPDHYDLISKIKTRPGSGTSLLAPQFNRFYVASQGIGDQEAAILVFEPVP